MARLIPRQITSAVSSLMFPAEVKQGAIQVFTTLAEPLDARLVSALVEQDVSIWQKLVPIELKEAIVQNVAEHKVWAKFVSESLALSWVLEARQDLVPVLDNATGRFWFYRQWAEILSAVGA